MFGGLEILDNYFVSLGRMFVLINNDSEIQVLAIAPYHKICLCQAKDTICGLTY